MNNLKTTLAASAHSCVLAAFALLACTMLPSVVVAATYYVRTDGNNSNAGSGSDSSSAWATLAYAVDQSLSAGDIVYVMPGTYSGEVSPSVDGTSGNPIQFIADRNGAIFGVVGEVVIQATSGQSLDVVDDDYLEFYGFILDGNSNSVDGLIWSNSDGGLLKDCVVRNGGLHGIVCQTGATLTLINCLIHDNTDDGVYVGGGDCTIWHCTIDNNGQDAFDQNTGSSTITNSIFTNSTYDGIEVDSGTCTHTYNLVYGNGDLNFEGTSASTGEITVDPVYVSSTDRHLRSTSPAINAATSASGTVDDDFHGNPRPYNGGWDMGYHEHESTSGGNNLAIVVQNDGYFTTAERYRKSTFEAWGYSVNPIYAGASQTVYDAALASVNVVYVCEQVSSSDVGYKLRETTLGIVNEERGLVDELGISGNFTVTSTTNLSIIDNSHYITSPFSTGSLSIFSQSTDALQMTATQAPGLQVLGELGSNESLAVLETDATLVNTYNSSNLAFGRRVQLPFVGDNFDWSRITTDGLTVIRRSLVWATTARDGHWKLDETSGTTTADSSGGGNNGTLVGGPSWDSDGIINGALALTADGSDRVTLPNSVLDGASDATFATWFRTTKGTGFSTLLSCANASNHNEFLILLKFGTQVGLTGGENPSDDVTWTLGAPYADGHWHHLAIVRDSVNNQSTLYLDGVSQGAKTQTLNALQVDSGGLILGEEQDSVGGGFNSSESFVGSLDDVNIFRDALTPAEIAELYGLIGHWKLDETSGTVAADSSLIGNDGGYYNGATPGASGPYPGIGAVAAEFDGTDDNVGAPSNSAYDVTEMISIAAWVRFDEAIADQTSQNFVLARTDWATQTGYAIFTDQPSGDRLTFRLFNGSSYADAQWTNSGIGANEWHHVVGTYDGTTMNLYVDGQLRASNNSFTGPIAPYANAWPGIGWTLDGRLHDVRLYNRPLNDYEITKLYGLTGHWPFDEGSSTTIADQTLISNDASFNTGTPTWIDGVYGKALEFDGTNDAATGTNFDPPGLGAVSFWMRSDGTPASTSRLWGVGASYEMYQGTDGLLVLDLGADGASGGQITSDSLDTADRWYHVVGLYDSGTDNYEIYINGELHKSGTSTSNIQDQAANLLTFGTRTGSTERFSGALDDFRIYNRWLSVGEINDLYGRIAHWKLDESSGTVAVDATEHSNDGTYVGTPTLGVSGAFAPSTGTAVALDGSSESIATSKSLLNDLTAFTMMGWVRADSLGAPQSFFGQNDIVELGLNASSGEIFLWTDVNSSYVSVDNQFPLGKWTHVTATGDGTHIKIYLNGVEAASGASVAASYGANSDVFKLGEGVFNATGDYFDGRFDDVQIFERALKPEEIFPIYRGGRPVGVRIRRWVEAR